jgi:hypothetical protein
MDPDEAAKLYLRRIEMKIPVFETMNENELNYVKMINAGQGFFYNNVSFNVSMTLSSPNIEGSLLLGLCTSTVSY